jgi:hypothetical protein
VGALRAALVGRISLVMTFDTIVRFFTSILKTSGVSFLSTSIHMCFVRSSLAGFLIRGRLLHDTIPVPTRIPDILKSSPLAVYQLPSINRACFQLPRANPITSSRLAISTTQALKTDKPHLSLQLPSHLCLPLRHRSHASAT